MKSGLLFIYETCLRLYNCLKLQQRLDHGPGIVGGGVKLKNRKISLQCHTACLMSMEKIHVNECLFLSEKPKIQISQDEFHTWSFA